ncbi:hypothetical protein NIES2135_61530 (plasmid) [Leptolyngbya boryana NIES-2135]|jgi:hypothetical protein|uniref:M23ase beta-sheet core domain-containing protein n=1 Tax=Leptolyngbya boryana NIES-2135 TaxID=1973484 RepID=A0A1Z4JRC5_LEPBY|nr:MULTISPECIES: DUF2927 domain-containing protein [Leptolyngbya]BAY59276.1 hypothetical protein NIES2135_61530 [Leptolyngbya boryana NIES-2135]MBD2372864.1 DUF2927 domain-containing protein [Leptolyngbya sp. FACHB-238]MBD2397383.1 DUF2927 domain-containing protein [Leptolyngbya sp. FACHB-239]MBD2403812.1 DUF2927 domain-containing protein [Leptolyngbya sp. FACHB-402]ULP33468.1 DUF2927 domain-containing protein [Leptolyngbya boryana IU 594]
MHIPGYLKKALDEANPEVRAQLAMQIARSQDRRVFWLKVWLHTESGLTLLLVLFTLSVLTISSINQRTTAWFQGFKLFGVALSGIQSAARLTTFNPEAGKPLKVGDTVAGFEITSGFGKRTHPVSGEVAFHNGVDAAMPVGTAIVAPFDGEVQPIANDSCGWGLRYFSPTMPNHRFGMCHFSEQVKGGSVKAGATIARSGGSPGSKGAGSSTGPHLHFVVSNRDGTPVPPTQEALSKFLTPAKTASTQSPSDATSNAENTSEASATETLKYFEEIALGDEFNTSAKVVKKWRSSIRYAVTGRPTQTDRETLQKVLSELHELTGLEFLYGSIGKHVITIHFVPVDQFKSVLPATPAGNLGYFEFNDQNNVITRARILISTTGVNQQERSHLIREEVTQALGLARDSDRYKDSIFTQQWTKTQQYSPIDKAVIRLLYDERIKPGMTIEQVTQALKSTRV